METEPSWNAFLRVGYRLSTVMLKRYVENGVLLDPSADSRWLSSFSSKSVLQYLFDMGAPNPLGSDNESHVVSMLAAATPKQLDILFAMGANISTFSRITGFSPFLFAASQGWTDSCVLLLENGADANEKTYYHRENAAILAARRCIDFFDDFRCLTELLSRGVNPFSRDLFGDTVKDELEQVRIDGGFVRECWEIYFEARKLALLHGHPCAIPDLAELVVQYV